MVIILNTMWESFTRINKQAKTVTVNINEQLRHANFV